MNQFSHRKFSYTVDVSAASAIFPKACGNPPQRGDEKNYSQKPASATIRVLFFSR
ncbi:MAG: hypothetical protein AAGF83_24455 [Cyanobacteria bacterium P01_G01_bin.67]